MNNNRIVYFDALKLFAIFLVIYGHALQLVKHPALFNIGIGEFIYSFHMPLFMIICGFFSYNSFQKDWYYFVKKKFIQLILPIFSWTMLICLFYLLNDKKQLITGEIIGNSWFLKVLFAIYLIVYLLKKTKIPEWILFILSVSVFIITPFSSFLQFNWMYIFFWIGFFFRKYYKRIIAKREMYMIFSMLLFISTYYFKKQLHIPNYIEINLSSIISTPTLHFLRFILSLSASFSFILLFSTLSAKFEKSKSLRYVSEGGKYTLGIYLSQTLILNNLYIEYVNFEIKNLILFNIIYTPILSIFILLICIVIIKILKQNSHLNLVLFGNQY